MKIMHKFQCFDATTKLGEEYVISLKTIWGRVARYGLCSSHYVMSHIACRIDKCPIVVNSSPSVGKKWKGNIMFT